MFLAKPWYFSGKQESTNFYLQVKGFIECRSDQFLTSLHKFMKTALIELKQLRLTSMFSVNEY